MSRTWFPARAAGVARAGSIGEEIQGRYFVVTKRGSRLRADDQAGALYALLFRTTRRYNLGYLTYVVGAPAAVWRDLSLAHSRAPDGCGACWRMSLPAWCCPQSPLIFARRWWCWRILITCSTATPGPLVGWVCLRSGGSASSPSRHEMRKTALFDRVLAFNVEPQRVSRRLAETATSE